MDSMNIGVPTAELTAQQAYDHFWPKQTDDMRTLEATSFKHQELPLARIKKIMKLDEDVKMISAEAPMLFAKAAEIFIHELTMRAWIHTEDNKRRTLQRNDIAMAIAKYDQFDFLIDIVPREDIKPQASNTQRQESAAASDHHSVSTSSVGLSADQVSYCLQGNTGGASGSTARASTSSTTAAVAAPSAAAATQQAAQQQPQVIQLQPQQMVNAMAPPPGGIQIVQQIVGPNGEIQQIPIQLTSQQLQMIRAQMTGGGQQQPLVIQTAPIQASTVQPNTATSAAAGQQGSSHQDGGQILH